MKNMNNVTCVVLNYNDAITTISLVNKIKKYNNIAHIVIVDNCSTDDSMYSLKKIIDDKVSVIESPTNGGYGMGNNIGVQYAKEHYSAKYVLIANPDVEFDSSLIDILRERMRENSNLAVVSANQKGIDGKLKKSGWLVPGKVKTILHGEILFGIILDKLEKYRLNRLPVQKGWVTVDCVAGSLLMVDADIFLEAGGYDPEIFLYCEEITLGKRLKDVGKETELYISKQYLHKHGVTISKTYNIVEQRRQLLKSTLIYLSKYCNVTDAEIQLFNILYKTGTVELICIKKIKNFLSGLKNV